MAVFVLVSATGSPGVSTTAAGLAYHWPRPVLLVDADPTGSAAFLAGRFRGQLEPGVGLIDLAVAAAEGRLDDVLPSAMARLPSTDRDLAVSPVRYLAGVRSHDQAASLRSLWPQLLPALRHLDEGGQDVIIDAGRLGLTDSPDYLIDHADVLGLVARNSLTHLAGTRSWADSLRTRYAATGGSRRLGLLLIDDTPRRVQSYGDGQIERALGVPVLVSLPHDKEAAEVYSHGVHPAKGFPTSSLVKAYAAGAQTLVGRHDANQAALDVPRLDSRVAPDAQPAGSRRRRGWRLSPSRPVDHQDTGGDADQDPEQTTGQVTSQVTHQVTARGTGDQQEIKGRGSEMGSHTVSAAPTFVRQPSSFPQRAGLDGEPSGSAMPTGSEPIPGVPPALLHAGGAELADGRGTPADA